MPEWVARRKISGATPPFRGGPPAGRRKSHERTIVRSADRRVFGAGPGPFAGGLLADFGADVIRVDRPGQPLLPPEYDFYNRNKRSIALDLKSAAGREAAVALVSAADVVIEGFRPG